MPNDGWVGPWRPHRPRGPTSAVYGSPGPKYGVPGGIGEYQRDPSGRRAPAFTFGMRLEGPEEPRSPGPQYLVPAGCTARGRERGPAFTMGGRPRERRRPGAEPSLPSRGRVKPRVPLSRVPSPGPATYQLPPVVGPRLVHKASTPQYTMTGRGPSIFDDNKKTPGPNKYCTVDTNLYMARAPRCTIAGRTPSRLTSTTPSPSDYYPKPDRKQGQTFGVRHSESVVPVMDLQL
uniref:Uncharacterized protein n=1 Tax=Geospiza parvula TaxID=87175 RepID=A0A8C3NDX4_GEOPR